MKAARKATASRARARRPARWERGFLAVLRQSANVTAAAAAVEVQRRTVYRRRENDPVFAARWDEALDEAADKLEGEAWRRAVQGVDEPVYQGGVEVGTIRRYDSRLLLALLQAHRPEKYKRAPAVQVTSPEPEPGRTGVIVYNPAIVKRCEKAGIPWRDLIVSANSGGTTVHLPDNGRRRKE